MFRSNLGHRHISITILDAISHGIAHVLLSFDFACLISGGRHWAAPGLRYLSTWQVVSKMIASRSFGKMWIQYFFMISVMSIFATCVCLNVFSESAINACFQSSKTFAAFSCTSKSIHHPLPAGVGVRVARTATAVSQYVLTLLAAFSEPIAIEIIHGDLELAYSYSVVSTLRLFHFTTAFSEYNSWFGRNMSAGRRRLDLGQLFQAPPVGKRQALQAA